MLWSTKRRRIRAIRLILVVLVFLAINKASAPNFNKSISVEAVEVIQTVAEPTKTTEVEAKAKTEVSKKAVIKAKPVEKPTPTVAERTYPSGCELYRDEVAKYKWNVEVAMAVMRAESRCNPHAANWDDSHNVCTGSFGLFQISCHSGQVYDPSKNIEIAWAKYVARGWQPWGVCNSGVVNCY